MWHSLSNHNIELIYGDAKAADSELDPEDLLEKELDQLDEAREEKKPGQGPKTNSCYVQVLEGMYAIRS